MPYAQHTRFASFIAIHCSNIRSYCYNNACFANMERKEKWSMKYEWFSPSFLCLQQKLSFVFAFLLFFVFFIRPVCLQLTSMTRRRHCNRLFIYLFDYLCPLRCTFHVIFSPFVTHTHWACALFYFLIPFPVSFYFFLAVFVFFSFFLFLIEFTYIYTKIEHLFAWTIIMSLGWCIRLYFLFLWLFLLVLWLDLNIIAILNNFYAVGFQQRRWIGLAILFFCIALKRRWFGEKWVAFDNIPIQFIFVLFFSDDNSIFVKYQTHTK